MKKEFTLPAEITRVNYALLFPNAHIESVCLERRMTKNREDVFGLNLQNVKGKKDLWRRGQKMKGKRTSAMIQKEPQGTGRRASAGRENILRKYMEFIILYSSFGQSV